MHTLADPIWPVPRFLAAFLFCQKSRKMLLSARRVRCVLHTPGFNMRTMTFAELVTALTIFGCGGSAGFVAAAGKAGWFTLPLILAGLVLGFGFACVVYKMADQLRCGGSRQLETWTGLAMLFASTFVPMLAGFSAMAITGCLAFAFVRHIL